MAETTTTIRVTTSTRDALNARAQQAGVTTGEYVALLVLRQEPEERRIAALVHRFAPMIADEDMRPHMYAHLWRLCRILDVRASDVIRALEVQDEHDAD